MGGFKFEQCGNIEGLYLVEPQVFSDERGYNLEAYHAGSFREAGLDMVFVQDNLSMSAKGTLRGMHFQKNYQQGKLVCVVSGEVFDAVVDIRDGSRRMASGLAPYFPQKRRTCCMYRKALHMAFWCFQILLFFLISCPIITIRRMRAAFRGMMKPLESGGPFRRT